MSKIANLSSALMMAALLCGCASVVPGQWTGSRTFIGVVRVDMPVVEGDVQAVRVRTLGTGGGRAGVFLGWEDGNWIVADPAKCQMLVIVRSPAEAENAARVLHELRGQNACLVDETGAQ
jgi:hypothetical protein